MSHFLKKEYINNIINNKYKRDDETNPVFFRNNLEAFNILKEDLVYSSVTKETWYKIIPPLQNLISQGVDYSQVNLLYYVCQLLKEKGVDYIPFDDIRNIVDFFVDEVKSGRRMSLSISVHFDLSTLLNIYYRDNRMFEAEYCIISDLVVIKCLPAIMMDATMESIKRGISILTTQKDYDALQKICEFGILTLTKNSEMHNKCILNLKKAKKYLNI